MDSEINLVPFIDLLSCLISFLIVTAVWTQIAALHVAGTGGLSDTQDLKNEDKETVDIKLFVGESGYKLTMERKGGTSPIAPVTTELAKVDLPAWRRETRETRQKVEKEKKGRDYIFAEKTFDAAGLVKKLAEECPRFINDPTLTNCRDEKGTFKYPASQVVMVTADDTVLYDDLLATIDALEGKELNFVSVSVAPTN